MRNITLAICFSLLAGFASAQITNSNFESWVADSVIISFPVVDTLAVERPSDWSTSSALIVQAGSAANVTKETTQVHAGDASVRIRTATVFGQSASGVLTNGSITYNGGTFVFTGGKPFTSRPGQFTGHYAYTPVNNDSARVWVLLSRWNGSSRDTVAFGRTTFYNAQPTYAKFQTTLDYKSSLNPDSALIVIVSSAGVTVGQANTVLLIDDVAFEFAAGLNGVDNNTISLYPNPVADRVVFDAAAGEYTEAVVYDLSGRVLHRAALTTNSVDVSLLRQGQYVLELRNGSAVVRSHFVKQ